MINNFIKLDSYSKNILQKITASNNFPVELTDEIYDKSQIEALIKYQYLNKYTEIETTDIVGGWHCWVTPTYEGKNYRKLEIEYYKEIIIENLKFILPLILSIVSLFK